MQDIFFPRIRKITIELNQDFKESKNIATLGNHFFRLSNHFFVLFVGLLSAL